MQFKTSIKSVFLTVATATLLSACSNDDDPKWRVDGIDFNTFGNYNSENYWEDCFESSSNAGFTIGDVHFTHSATDWGNGMLSWNGFCPSRSTDNTDYSGDAEQGIPDDWYGTHEWSAKMEKYQSGVAPTYMVGYWNSAENVEDLESCTSCVISRPVPFIPYLISVTNTTLTYYTLKNGNTFCKKFDSDDKLILHAIGVRDGVKTADYPIYLAKDGQILDDWITVNLSALGEVDKIIFTMESTDNGAYGMNSPAYFCIGDFTWLVPTE